MELPDVKGLRKEGFPRIISHEHQLTTCTDGGDMIVDGSDQQCSRIAVDLQRNIKELWHIAVGGSMGKLATCIDGLCNDIVFMNGRPIEIGANINEGRQRACGKTFETLRCDGRWVTTESKQSGLRSIVLE